MTKEVEEIYASLQTEFTEAYNSYSVVFIEGETKAETVARILNILEHGARYKVFGKWNPFCSMSERVCHYQTGTANGYTFAVFKGEPDVLAYNLSEYFPDKIVISVTDWDMFRLFICKNGHMAKFGKDYKMTLRIFHYDYYEGEFVNLECSIFSMPDNRLLYATSYDTFPVSRLDVLKSLASIIEEY